MGNIELLQYRVEDPQLWLIPPQHIITEIRFPGRTGMTGIIPTSATAAWPNSDASEIEPAQLNNLHLKLMWAYAPTDLLFAAVLRDPQSFGMSILDNARDEQVLRYSDFEGYSIKYLTSNCAAFVQDIRHIVGRAGISDSDIIQMLNEYDQSSSIFSEHYERIGPPIYKVLKEAGYADRELLS